MSKTPAAPWAWSRTFLSETAANDYIEDHPRRNMQAVAEKHARGEADKQRMPLADARDNAFKPDWQLYAAQGPDLSGHAGPSTIAIWPSWRDTSTGRPSSRPGNSRALYPKILDDERQGEAARQLFVDAQAMLEQIIAEKWFTPKAVVGFWPANRDGRRCPALHR